MLCLDDDAAYDTAHAVRIKSLVSLNSQGSRERLGAAGNPSLGSGSMSWSLTLILDC